MEKLYLVLILVFGAAALISLPFFLKSKQKSPGVICALSGLLVIVFAVLSLFNQSGDSAHSDEQKSYVTVTKSESASARNYSERSVRTSAKSSVTDKQSDAETTSAEQSKNKTVYITKTGKKYHYTYPCGNGIFYECPLQEAKDRGLEPCKRCVLNQKTDTD